MTAPTHLSDRSRAVRSSEIRDLLRLAERPGVISLAGGLPDPAGFPLDALAAATDAALAEPTRSLQYSATEGDEGLRQLLATRHEALTGRPTSPDQVIVTTGSQQGLDLLARALGDPGDEVVVEDPSYLGALQAMRAAGLRTTGIPVDGDGLDVDALEHHLTRAGGTATRPVRLVYVVPTFQNPTGTTLAPDRRLRLAELADRHGLVIVEDEPYAALRVRGTAPAPVASLSPRTVSLGTVSKTLAPGLRVGWLIGPADVVATVVRLKQAVDLHTSGLCQAVVRHLLGDADWFDAHLARLREAYAARAVALRSAVVEHLGGRFEVTDPDGGMFLWATSRPGSPALDARSLLPLTIDAGTAFVPGDAFAAGDPRRWRGAMRLSFATSSPGQLRDAAARLARAVDRLDRGATTAGARPVDLAG